MNADDNGPPWTHDLTGEPPEVAKLLRSNVAEVVCRVDPNGVWHPIEWRNCEPGAFIGAYDRISLVLRADGLVGWEKR